MSSVPRSSAPQAAVANIPRERYTESSDASCELRAESVLPRISAVATFVSFWQCSDLRERGSTQAQLPHSSIATSILETDADR